MVLQGWLLPRLGGPWGPCKLVSFTSLTLSFLLFSHRTYHRNEEAATRIMWFEEGKLDLYLASRTTCWVGLSL